MTTVDQTDFSRETSAAPPRRSPTDQIGVGSGRYWGRALALCGTLAAGTAVVDTGQTVAVGTGALVVAAICDAMIHP